MMTRKNTNVGKLCNIAYAQNENSDLQITSHNNVFLFIQGIEKKNQSLRKVSTKKSNNEEKTAFYISSENRNQKQQDTSGD